MNKPYTTSLLPSTIYQLPTTTHRVAIVHDWLVGGGAERVVEQLHKTYPDAPIYTSYCTPEWREKLDGKVVTGYLQWWPLGALRKFLGPLRVLWFSHLNLRDFDLVISSSGNGEAKDINTAKHAKHICYCHAPTHFYWRNYKGYMQNPGFGFLNPLARLGLRILVNPMRKRDYKAAQKPDLIIANSNFIAEEIKKYYGRDSVVINPPVATDIFKTNGAIKRSGFVTVGRQVPYKKTDLIIRACSQLGLPLEVIGTGPEHNKLISIAGPTVRFHGRLSNEAVVTILSESKGFIFAAEEDFGIAPVEALAAGTPVIAYKAGGAIDYVKNHETGLFFEKQDIDSLVSALEDFQEQNFKHDKISNFAQRFSSENFRKKFDDAVSSIIKV